VRLQAAAPGVPVVPLPIMPAEAANRSGWWPMRARRAVDRSEVVGLLQQLALLDQGARQLFYLATHDRLTGLANRWLLEERLAHAVARSRRGSGRGALLFIDLDDFKAVNDRHGHEVGDRMLVVAAQRLQQVVRASDTVARWGGDEFAILLEGVERHDVAHAKGRELVEQLAQPSDAVPMVGPLCASVGVALFPSDGDDAATLMAQADRRMYRAKGRRVLWSVFRRG
jgi:diguanylate cyclase (GGDEF)-like protein